jgi:hypothetical protein
MSIPRSGVTCTPPALSNVAGVVVDVQPDVPVPVVVVPDLVSPELRSALVGESLDEEPASLAGLPLELLALLSGSGASVAASPVDVSAALVLPDPEEPAASEAPVGPPGVELGSPVNWPESGSAVAPRAPADGLSAGFAMVPSVVSGG